VQLTITTTIGGYTKQRKISPPDTFGVRKAHRVSGLRSQASKRGLEKPKRRGFKPKIGLPLEPESSRDREVEIQMKKEGSAIRRTCRGGKTIVKVPSDEEVHREGR